MLYISISEGREPKSMRLYGDPRKLGIEKGPTVLYKNGAS
jgi:hypothetical protein